MRRLWCADDAPMSFLTVMVRYLGRKVPKCRIWRPRSPLNPAQTVQAIVASMDAAILIACGWLEGPEGVLVVGRAPQGPSALALGPTARGR